MVSTDDIEHLFQPNHNEALRSLVRCLHDVFGVRGVDFAAMTTVSMGMGSSSVLDVFLHTGDGVLSMDQVVGKIRFEFVDPMYTWSRVHIHNLCHQFASAVSILGRIDHVVHARARCCVGVTPVERNAPPVNDDEDIPADKLRVSYTVYEHPAPEDVDEQLPMAVG